MPETDETWLTLKKEIAELRKERFVFFAEARSALENQRRFLAGMLAKIESRDRKADKAFLNMHKEIVKHNYVVENIAKTNACVEESLCNVLLAIRQNEYLQAYYPAQNGHLEMKITGIHPAKL